MISLFMVRLRQKSLQVFLEVHIILTKLLLSNLNLLILGRIHFADRVMASTRLEVINSLNNAIDACDEGNIFKTIKS